MIRRRRSGRRTTSGLALLLGGLVACGALRENPIGDDDDTSPDAAEPDEEAPDAAGEPDVGSDANVKPPIRADVACAGSDAWFEVERSAECSSRKIRVVQEMPPSAITSGHNLDIAWSLAGRAGIVLNWMSGFNEGGLQALTFDTAREGFVVRQDSLEPPGLEMLEGAGARIVSRADGSFEVLSMLNEADIVGDVFLRTLPKQQPFTEPIRVFSGADPHARLGLLIQHDSSVLATAVMPAGTDLAIVTKRRQPQNTEFDDAFLSTLTFFQPGPYSNGNHRMTVDSLGGVYLVYEHGFSTNRSQPRFVQLIGTAWDNRRTVDNNVPDSISGTDLSVVMIGEERNIVYLSQVPDGDGGATANANLVRARWRGTDDPIERDVLAEGFSTSLGGIDGTAAAAAEASGALHVVYARIVVPGTEQGGRLCQVFYLHEAAKENGALEMLTDVISPQMACDNQVPPVALAVEPTGRPHIAYVAPVDGVVYATRYDR